MVGALTLSTATFVGLTSIFVAIMAFALGPQQMATAGLEGARQPDSAARWLAYATGVVSSLNVIVALGRARKRPGIAIVSAGVFVATMVSVLFLFVNAL